MARRCAQDDMSRRTLITGLRRVVGIAAFSFLPGCFSDPEPAPTSPTTTGTIHVRVTTSGTDPDDNGYFVHIDQRSITTRIGINETFPIRGVMFGQHSVSISDIANNCRLEPAAVTVTISATAPEVTADIRVICEPLGRVRFTAVTTGVDLDANGYTATVTSVVGNRSGVTVAANGTVLTARLPAGRYMVHLQELAVNCALAEPLPTSIDMASDATVDVAIGVTCQRAGWLAYTAVSPDGDADIYRFRSNGADVTRLTRAIGTDEDPAWSPDGREIVFTSDRDGVRGVYLMNEDGTGVVRLTPPTHPSYQPGWAPDGQRLAFVSERDGNAEIYVMNRDGSNAVRLTNDIRADREPAWSPDGRQIAFSSDRAGQAEIYVMNADGSSLTKLTSNTPQDGQPAWSPDGKSIAFARKRCDTSAPNTCYPMVMIKTGPDEPFDLGMGEHPRWSPDGRRLAITRFTCPYNFYFYIDCTRGGLGIYGVGSRAIPRDHLWEFVLTTGLHHSPTWRP